MQIVRILLLMISLLLAGCNSFVTESTTLSPPTQYIKRHSTQVPTMNNTPHPTFTLIPSTPEPKATSTRRFNTETAALEKLDIVANLYAYNADCRFPCWWGIIPGETTWPEAIKLMEDFLSSWYEYTNYVDRSGYTYYIVNIYIPVESVDGRVLHSFFFSVRDDNSVIESISHDMDADLIEMYQIPVVISEYGKPDSIILSSIVGHFVDIYLYYPQIGFLSFHKIRIQYEETDDVNVDVCASHQTYSGLILWDPKKIVSTEMLTEMWPGYWYAEFFPLEQVSNYSIDDFYKIFTDPQNQCMEVRTDLR